MSTEWSLVEAMVWAISTLADPVALGLVIGGALIGVLIGSIPGIGAVTTLALLIPISFGLGTSHALVFLIGALGGVNFGGSIPAILLNIPGTAPSVMTTIDGAPMSQDNRGNEALGASATASLLGALVGAVFIFAAIPVFKQILLLFGPPEFMLVAFLGLFAIVYVLQGSFVNGIIGGGIGIIFGFHGFNNVTGSARYVFDIGYLYDGVQLIPLVLGLYAIAEMVDLILRKQSIATDPDDVQGSPLKGVIETLKNWRLVVGSASYGIIFGFIPGAGAVTAIVVAYSRAKAKLPDTELFGKGDIRGVIAPEAANDAKDGGALLPTVAFGVPGTPAHAVLLGGLILHGITPGPGAFSRDLNFIYLLIFALILSNVFTSVLGLSLTRVFVKITKLPSPIIVAPVVVFAMVGAFTIRNHPLDMIVTLLLGILGYGALRFDMSRIAMLFGLLLGPLIEDTFHQTLQIARGDPMAIFTRTGFAGILTVIILLSVYLVYLNQRNAARSDT